MSTVPVVVTEPGRDCVQGGCRLLITVLESGISIARPEHAPDEGSCAAAASVRAADANAGATGRGPRTSRDADSIRADSSSIFEYDWARSALACTALDSSAVDVA
ncbi:hypothetical protein HND25_26720 [Rhodococcus erythropolis]|uniref:hypothetical protein n=1 Tax=Rhodococcus erythropolis TaxID=1833 RepID=UPI0012BD7445|nr:hypothetical protein [Rhodococcus erythropolis]MBO8149905.1 hypothetical protein [Rhodococcus erythropolis]MDO1492174.1 hypothetical protein [Rhodococcus erythropolis]